MDLKKNVDFQNIFSLTLLQHPCSWHVMKDALTGRTHRRQVRKNGRHNKSHNLQFHMHSFFLCSFTDSAQTSQYIHKHYTHTHYPTQPSPCAHLHTHTNTKMDQFRIPFQDAEDAVSHFQFMAWCLIPPNAAMQIRYCYSFFFLLCAIFFFTAWYVPNNYAASCGLFFENRAEFLAKHYQNNNEVN